MRSPLPLLCIAGSACLYWEPHPAVVPLDYHIDRPLVAAITFDPPSLRPGHPVTVDALVLTPRGDAPEAVSIDVCGLKEGVLAQVWGYECFTEPELVEHLGSELPVTWTPPDPGIGCEVFDSATDTGWYLCSTSVPLMVTTTTTADSGRAGVQMDISADGTLPSNEHPKPHLTVTATGEAEPGGRVELEVIVWSGIPDEYGVRWYVDAGELRGTGRTRNNGGEALYVSRNTLTIPEDWHGPLRVYAVAQMTDSEVPNVGWAHTTVEVP